MKFLIDQGLPRSTIKKLSQLQIDSIHVGDIGMSAASGEDKPSVIRIRIEGLKADKLAELIQSVIGSVYNEIMNGAAISITEKGIRVRKLPLV